MRRFNEFSALFLAPLMSGNLFHDVARNWRGIGLRYLLLLLLVTWAVVMVKAHVSIRHFAANEFPRIVKDVPPIDIKDGLVSSPVTQPYEIKDPDTGKVMAVLDTTGKINSLDDTPAVILVTQNKLHYRDENQGQTRTQDLSSIKSFSIDRQRISGWMDLFTRWYAIVATPVALMGSFIYRVVQSLIYAAIGLAFAAGFGTNLRYAQLIRLAIMSVTPVILADTVLTLLGVYVPFWSLICLVIAMVWLVMAVKANANTDEQLQPGQMPYTPPGMPPMAPPT